MKKIISVTAMAVWTITVFAQQNKVVSAYNYLKYYVQDKNYDDLKKAKAAIDEATAHADTKEKAKTHLYRGDIYIALFDYTRAEEIKKSTETDDNKKKYAAYRALSMTELDEAYKAYLKTIDLDTKKGFTEDVMKQMRVIYSDYMDKFNSELNAKLYGSAIPAYEKADGINAAFFPMRIDTGSLYNYALCAQRTKDYPMFMVQRQRRGGGPVVYGNISQFEDRPDPALWRGRQGNPRPGAGQHADGGLRTRWPDVYGLEWRPFVPVFRSDLVPGQLCNPGRGRPLLEAAVRRRAAGSAAMRLAQGPVRRVLANRAHPHDPPADGPRPRPRQGRARDESHDGHEENRH